MKTSQKILCFVAITLGILFIGVGKIQAASLSLSPDSGVTESTFTISGSGFTAGSSVIVHWDSAGLDTSNTSADGSGNYSSSANVPAGALAGGHIVNVTGPGSFLPSYGPKNSWISRIFLRALAAEGDIIASATFTVTSPPVTPATPPATSPANSTATPSNNTTPTTNKAAPAATGNSQTTTEPVAPTVSTSVTEPTTQNEPTKEVKKGVRMCYFPWWDWLLLVLITLINLALFLSRFWKKKSKQSE